MLSVNNAPLMGTVLDISNISESYRDGLKLRQEYDARQQQKALNQLMAIPDFNERMNQARQHKYAGALVPELQKYEEARQKAALDNLKASADIGKVFAESGKLGAESGKIDAETGKIGVETVGQTIKNVSDTQDHISALALAQDPKVFAIGIGELNRQGLITPDQAEMMIKMVGADPQSAAAVLQSMARTNPDVAKIFAPKIEYSNLGDKVQATSFDPLANSATPLGTYTVGQSPDNFATNATSEANNIRTNQASIDNNIRSNETSLANNQNSVAGQRYVADANNASREGIASQDTAVKWFTAQNKAQNDAANTQIKAYEAQNPKAKQRGPVPAAVIKSVNVHKKNLQNNAATLKENTKWIKKLESGALTLGAKANAGNQLALSTGINKLGSNPKDYAEYHAYLKDLANKALRLNAGVQTDADYKRQLEAIVAGTSLPRNNAVAIQLLSRVQRDFDTQNRAEYDALREYRREYYGQNLPAYGQSSNPKPAPKTTKQSSKSQAIGQKVFGGK